MEAAIGSLLAGGCVGGIGMLLKSSAASQNILADAMARTDTTPVNDVRSHLITSGLNSTQSEMYGETYSAQPITYKERPCLVKKEITLRVYKTHIWVEPVEPVKNKEGRVVREGRDGYWRNEQRSQVSCSRRADPHCRLIMLPPLRHLAGLSRSFIASFFLLAFFTRLACILSTASALALVQLHPPLPAPVASSFFSISFSHSAVSTLSLPSPPLSCCLLHQLLP